MIQGFVWDPTNQHQWYTLVASKAHELRDAKIDLIWLPHPAVAMEWVTINSTLQLRQRVRHLGSAPRTVEIDARARHRAIADVVINHRNGTNSWAHFTNPDWPASFICADDEFWGKNPIDGDLSAEDRQILAAGNKGANDTGDHEGGCRDLDHTNPRSTSGEKLPAKAQGVWIRGWRSMK